MAEKRKCLMPRCGGHVAEKFLMCRMHWQLVPAWLQDLIWRELFHGSRRKIHPTPEYERAVKVAIETVAARSTRRVA